MRPLHDAAWVIIAAAVAVGYAQCLSRGDLYNTANYALSSVFDKDYNRPLMLFPIAPAFFVVLVVLGVAAEDLVTRASIFGLGVGFVGVAGFNCNTQPIAHDVSTVVMAASGLSFAYRVRQPVGLVVSFCVTLTVGYTCHFVRGFGTPEVVTFSHHAWSLGHGAAQWLLLVSSGRIGRAAMRRPWRRRRQGRGRLPTPRP